MELGTIRPLAPPPTPAVPKPLAVEDPVTELPGVAVGAAGESLETNLRSRDESGERPTKRRVERDEATDTLVFSTVDETTGEVVRQIPTEELLKVRAMAQAFGEATLPKPNGVDVVL